MNGLDVVALALAAGANANALKLFPTEPSSGGVASTELGADGVPVKSASATLPFVQGGSGDPTPSNVRPITTYDEANLVKAGKNLLDESLREVVDDKIWYGLDDAAFFLPAGTFTICASEKVSQIAYVAAFPDGTGTSGSSSGDEGVTELTFTLAQAASVSVSLDISVLGSDDAYAWLVVGSSAADYAAYSAESKTLSFGREVVEGNLNILTGVLATDWIIAEGTVGVHSIYPDVVVGQITVSNLDGRTVAGIKSSHFSSSIASGVGRCSVSGNKIYFIMARDAAPNGTAAEVESWLTENGVQFVLQVNSDVQYQLPPARITSNLGPTNLFAEEFASMSVTFRCDPALYAASLISA